MDNIYVTKQRNNNLTKYLNYGNLKIKKIRSTSNSNWQKSSNRIY